MTRPGSNDRSAAGIRLAGRERNRRHLRAARLYGRRKGRNRRRLARILGAEFSAGHPARCRTRFSSQKPISAGRTPFDQVGDRNRRSVVCPGRVFRNEAISYRAHCIFHQVEGLYIDENVSFADLKQSILYFAKEMFGEKAQIRMRPSYFPFTEPSAEVDVSCNLRRQRMQRMQTYRLARNHGLRDGRSERSKRRASTRNGIRASHSAWELNGSPC